MDGPIHLDPAIGARPSPDFVDFFAALANTRATDEMRLAEAESALARVRPRSIGVSRRSLAAP
jgi:hypothetical protein